MPNLGSGYIYIYIYVEYQSYSSCAVDFLMEG